MPDNNLNTVNIQKEDIADSSNKTNFYKTKKSVVKRRKRLPIDSNDALSLDDSVDTNIDMNSAADKDKSSEDTEDNNTNSNNASNIAEDDKDSLANVSVEIAELRKRDITSLLDFSSQIGADVAVGMAKQDILMSILKRIVFAHGSVIGSGMIEILPEGFGFLRSTECNYVSCANDIYVSSNQIRKFGLRTGDMIKGMVRAPKRGERYFALQKVLDVNNDSSHSSKYRVNFDDLIPLYPVEKINLECDMQSTISSDISSRIVDLIAPLGKGQRALIVAPPRTGKTILMQNIAHSISTNHPDISLIVLLIDERPEEVTDMSRSVKGEVISSTFDEPAIRHVQLANMVIEKAKRMVERKKDVVILLDSITRLARAYNTVVPSSGKVLTGGVDANALQRPKRFFGAARNIEQGGSLTIIATALVETGSRMDEVIFEEFKGTGNSEIVLDRKIADKRIFPAIDITRSSTRKEELLVDKAILGKMWVLRRLLVQMAPLEAIEFLRDKIKQSKSNCDFFNLMNN